MLHAWNLKFNWKYIEFLEWIKKRIHLTNIWAWKLTLIFGNKNIWGFWLKLFKKNFKHSLEVVILIWKFIKFCLTHYDIQKLHLLENLFDNFLTWWWAAVKGFIANWRGCFVTTITPNVLTCFSWDYCYGYI